MMVIFILLSGGLAIAQVRITGKVTDHQGVPLVMANIVVVESNRGTFTDDQGRFDLGWMPPGTYKLVVSHIGFVTKVDSVVLQRGENQKLEFRLTPAAITIPGVIVQAPADESRELIKLPSRTQTLDQREIERIPANSVAHLLGSVSGVHVRSEFGIFSSSAVTIRGVGGDQQTGTLVVLDGVPLNNSDGGSVNWNIIDKDNISKMEVIKGPGSALFGTNAMGGVINIVTLQPEAPLTGKASVSYGTYNTLEAKANFQGITSAKRFFWKTFAHYRHSDGYVNTPEEIILENDSIVVPVFLKELFFGGLAGINFNPHHSLEYSLHAFQDIRGRGTKIYEELGASTTRHTVQSFLKYKGRIDQWKWLGVAYGLYEHYFRLNEYFSDGEYKLYEVDAHRKDFGMRFIAEREVSSHASWVLGAESKFGRVEASDIYYTSTDIISNGGALDIHALFVQYALSSGNSAWKMVAGLRYDFAAFHDAQFGIEFPSYAIEYFSDFTLDDSIKRNWNSLSPKWILQYTPQNHSRWYISVAKGFRAPVLDDVCRSSRSSSGLRAANTALKPEYIYSFEGGADHLFFGKLKSSFSAYLTLGQNFMHPLSTGDSVNLGYTLAPVYKVSNIGMVRIVGMEYDLTWQINPRLVCYGNYTLTHAMITGFDPFTTADPDLTGKFLSNIPLHKGSAGIRWNLGVHQLVLHAGFTGKRWIRDDNEMDQIYLQADRYDPLLTLDAKWRCPWGPVVLSLEVENISNEIYINSKGYRSPGRMLFFSVSYHLKSKKKIIIRDDFSTIL